MNAIQKNQQKKVVLFAFLSAILLNISILMFFFMVPLIYVYYRYSAVFFKKCLLYSFLFSVAILLISEVIFWYSITANSNLNGNTSSVQYDVMQFINQFLFISSWFVMLLLYANSSKIVWQFRLPMSTMVVFFCIIPVLSYMESMVKNTTIFSDLAAIFQTDSEQIQIFYEQIFSFFRNNLAWVSMIIWFLSNWFIAISILSKRYTAHPNNYFTYLFEKIKRDFVSRTFLVIGGALWIINSFVVPTWQGSSSIVLSVMALFFGNFLFVVLFLYIIRGLVVLHSLFMYKILVRKDLYFIAMCAIVFIPIVGQIVVYILLFSGILQDLVHIEQLKKRKN